MLVRDVMARPVTVAPEDAIQDVARAMVQHGVPAVVVADGRGRARGVITEADFLAHGELPYSERGEATMLRVNLPGRGAETALADARTVPAHRIMRPLDAVVGREDPLEKALALMIHRGRTNVIVVQGPRAIGLVSGQDLVRLAAGPGHDVSDREAPAPRRRAAKGKTRVV